MTQFGCRGLGSLAGIARRKPGYLSSYTTALDAYGALQGLFSPSSASGTSLLDQQPSLSGRTGVLSPYHHRTCSTSFEYTVTFHARCALLCSSRTLKVTAGSDGDGDRFSRRALVRSTGVELGVLWGRMGPRD